MPQEVIERHRQVRLLVVVSRVDLLGRPGPLDDPVTKPAAGEMLAALEPDHVPARRADLRRERLLAETDPFPGPLDPGAVLGERELAWG